MDLEQILNERRDNSDFNREFAKGIAQILGETTKEIFASLQNRITALETRVARVEAGLDTAAAAKTLKLVGTDG
jgi:hypothetical protein